MGLANLATIDQVIDTNRKILEEYGRHLAGIEGVSLIAYDDKEQNNHHYVVVELDETFPVSRDDVVAALHAENILARKYFWPGCHRMQPYAQLYPHAGLVLPMSELVASRVLVLPSGTTLPPGTAACIADIMRVLSRG